MNTIKINDRHYGFVIEPINNIQITGVVYRIKNEIKTTLEQKWINTPYGATKEDYEEVRRWCLEQLQLIKHGNRKLSKSERI